jgi:hypothetical protein
VLSFEDASLILMKLSLIENLSLLIPKIIQSIETSTVLNEHSQAERYLEKTFEVMYNLMQASTEVRMRFCGSEAVLKEGFIKLIRKTINDPSPVTLNIIKRFIKLL